MTEIKRFSDLLPSGEVLEGEKIKMNDLLEKEVIIYAFKTIPDQFHPDGTVTLIQLDMNGKRYVTFTRSGVLLKQLDSVRQQLPLRGQIVRRGKYFSFA